MTAGKWCSKHSQYANSCTECAKPKLRERDIARTIGDLLELDGWRLLWCEPMSRKDLGKGFGSPGMADLLCIRYRPKFPRLEIQRSAILTDADVLWIEFKRPGGVVSTKQKAWHEAERARGALTIILGVDCEASIEGWMAWYHASGLNRGKV